MAKKKVTKLRQRKTDNPALALEAIADLIHQVCACGHMESDHFIGARLKAVNCAECKCPKFDPAYSLEINAK